MNQKTPHTPILLNDVIQHLNPQPNDIILDGTLGFGGHAEVLLSHLSDKGLYIGLDQDPNAIAFCEEKFKEKKNLQLCQENFINFEKVLKEKGIKKVNKVLLDLGMSSFQLDHPERGFSFQGDSPLDMRMNPKDDNTAADLLNSYSQEQLSNMFYQYGELKHNKKLCEAIIHTRKKSPLNSTSELVALIKQSYRFGGNRRFFIRTCSQVFQAIRIEVNQELTRLEAFLEKLLSYLEPQSRVAILTFHSLEDRLVKQFVKSRKYELSSLTKKVIKPSQDEIRLNSRASCAKLRVFEKII